MTLNFSNEYKHHTGATLLLLSSSSSSSVVAFPCALLLAVNNKRILSYQKLILKKCNNYESKAKISNDVGNCNFKKSSTIKGNMRQRDLANL